MKSTVPTPNISADELRELFFRPDPYQKKLGRMKYFLLSGYFFGMALLIGLAMTGWRK